MIGSKINLRHLRAFVLVADSRNVTAAAEEIHLSQPAVTQAINGLERLFEVALFERRPTGLYLTEAGELLCLRARMIFEHLESGIRISGQLAKLPVSIKHAELIRMTHLRALIAIHKSGSFGLAARQAGVSQSTLHRSVHDLQELLQIGLLDTSYKGVQLTEAATALVRNFLLVSNELRQMRYELSSLNGRDSTTIVAGSMPLSRTMILPETIYQMQQQHDGVSFRSVEGPYRELLNGLLDGEIDFLIGAMRDPLPSEDIVQEELFVDPLAIVAGSRHPLANKDRVTLEECIKYPWIAPPQNTPAGQLLSKLLKSDHRQQNSVRVVTSSSVMTRGLLMKGDYLTLISAHQMAVELNEGLVEQIKVALPSSARPIGLSWRKNWRPTRTQKRFLELLRQNCRRIASPDREVDAE